MRCIAYPTRACGAAGREVRRLAFNRANARATTTPIRCPSSSPHASESPDSSLAWDSISRPLYTGLGALPQPSIPQGCAMCDLHTLQETTPRQERFPTTLSEAGFFDGMVTNGFRLRMKPRVRRNFYLIRKTFTLLLPIVRKHRNFLCRNERLHFCRGVSSDHGRGTLDIITLRDAV